MADRRRRMSVASRPSRQRVTHLDRLSHGCSSRKICHPDWRAAFDAAELGMQRGHVHPGCHLTPFRCRECGYWHVGNRQIVESWIVAEYAAGLRG